MDKKKILWVSDSPLLTTGFGRNTLKVCEELVRRGYEIQVMGLQYMGHPIEIGGFLLLPNPGGGGDSGILQSYIRSFKPDFLVSVMDIWNTGFVIDAARKTGVPHISYIPIDGEPIPTRFAELASYANIVLVTSKYSQRVLADRGVFSTVWYNGYDPKILGFTDFDHKEKLKRELGLSGFIICSVSRNISRKQVPLLIEAFKKFEDRGNKKDVSLLLVMKPMERAGWNLENVVKNLRVRNPVRFPSQMLSPVVGEDERNVARFIMASDVHALATCYLPETPIICNPIIKPISEIKENDKILTKSGKFEKVKHKFEFDYNGEILKILPYYSSEINITPNHKVFVVKNEGKNIKKKEPVIQKIEAKDLKKGDFLLMPKIYGTKTKKFLRFKKSYGRNQFGAKFIHPTTKQIPSEVKIDNDLMWLFGIYLAEGCISQHFKKVEGIVFSISTKEEEFTGKILNIMKNKFGLIGKVKDDSRHRRRIIFYSANIGRKFKHLFGSGAKNKKMPNWLIFLPHSKQEVLIKGLWDGDGCVYFHPVKKASEMDYQTVSKQLSEQMRLILIRLGYLVSSSSHQRKNMVYRLRIMGKQKWEFAKILETKLKETGEGHQIGFTSPKFLFLPIRKIEKENYSGKVFDLQIENNHSYSNCSFVAHNSGEGYGLSILESMVCGTPNVVTDFSSPHELLMGGRGVLIKPVGYIYGQYEYLRAVCDSSAMADAFEKLYRNPELRKKIAETAYDWAKQWTWQRIVDDLEKILNDFEDIQLEALTLQRLMEVEKYKKEKMGGGLGGIGNNKV